MSLELLYATSNPGKVVEVSKMLWSYKIKVVSPKDLGINLDVPETGNTLEENAKLKAKAYLAISDGRVVLADDTGVEIDSLNGDPGIHVRRWKDKKIRMGDDEIIKYCLEQMKNVPKGKRGAQFRTVLALATSGNEVEIFDGILRGEILEKDAHIRLEGFPFGSIFFISEWNMLLGDSHQLTAAEKGDRLSHRERALQNALPRIKELIQTS